MSEMDCRIRLVPQRPWQDMDYGHTTVTFHVCHQSMCWNIGGCLEGIHAQVKHVKHWHFDPVNSVMGSVIGEDHVSPLARFHRIPRFIAVTAIKTAVCRIVTAAVSGGRNMGRAA